MLVGKKLDMFLENFDIFCDWDEVKEVPVTPASAPVQETPAITTEPEKTSTNNP
jgi:hypothetical protein